MDASYLADLRSHGLTNRQHRRICRWWSRYPPLTRPPASEVVSWTNYDFMQGTPIEEEFDKSFRQAKENTWTLPETESLLQCHSCGQRKVEMRTQQTRSADEPETIFAHCRHCGKRWRQ